MALAIVLAIDVSIFFMGRNELAVLVSLLKALG
jgi:hypothetical protein